MDSSLLLPTLQEPLSPSPCSKGSLRTCSRSHPLGCTHPQPTPESGVGLPLGSIPLPFHPLLRLLIPSGGEGEEVLDDMSERQMGKQAQVEVSR